MRFAALWMALPIALAGCLQGEGPGGDDDGTGAPAPTELVFGGPLRLPGEQVAAEPNLIAADGGRVWVVAPGALVGSPNMHRGEVSLWYSQDAGASWETLRAPVPRTDTSQFCSCDADIALGPDGALYLTDFYTFPVSGFVVEASPDEGRTWGPGNSVTVTNLVGNDRQYINAGDAPGEVYLSYARGSVVGGLLPIGQPDAGLHLWRSTDGGVTFAAQTLVHAGDSALIAKPRMLQDGGVLYGWMEVDGDGLEAPSTVLVAKSTDEGASFGAPVVVAQVPNGGGAVWPFQFDVGPDGMVHAVWMERGPGGIGSGLYYSSSTDAGASFTAPSRIGWSNGTSVLPWIAHAGEGRAVVAFYGTRATVAPREAPADTPWSAYALTIDRGVAGAPVRASPFPVKVGTFCPEGASCPEDRELLDYPGVVWHEGLVHVAFSVSLLDEGAGEATGLLQKAGAAGRGHATAGLVWVASAPWA